QQNLKCNAMNPKNPAASLYENRAKLVNQALTPDLELLKRLQDLPYLNPDYQLPANLEIAQQEILNLRQQVKELAIDRDKTVAEIITISKNHRERQIQELTEQKDKAIQLLKEENHQLKEQLNQQKLERESFDKLVVDEAKRRTFFSYRGHEPYGTINNKQYCASCWKCANCQQHLGKMVNGYNGTIYEENEEKEKSDKIPHCFVLYCKTCYKEETCSNCNRLTERDLCLECSVQARIRDEFNNSYGETPPPTHTFYNKCECGNSKPTSNIR
ncbi:19091_t:CDS:2, partial [Entrophospora sp. SA101]